MMEEQHQGRSGCGRLRPAGDCFRHDIADAHRYSMWRALGVSTWLSQLSCCCYSLEGTSQAFVASDGIGHITTASFRCSITSNPCTGDLFIRTAHCSVRFEENIIGNTWCGPAILQS